MTMNSILAESEAPSEVDPPPSPAADKPAEVSCDDAVVILVKEEVVARAHAAKESKRSEDLLEDRVCRICHLSPDGSMDLEHEEKGLDPDLILIGCGCKNELGTAHRHCAETWFRLKGNRCCEICGKNAKNITGDEDGSFFEGWHGNRVQNNNNGSRNLQGRASCWRGQPLCNFLMACLIIAFILPWFFRVNMF